MTLTEFREKHSLEGLIDEIRYAEDTSDPGWIIYILEKMDKDLKKVDSIG